MRHAAEHPSRPRRRRSSSPAWLVFFAIAAVAAVAAGIGTFALWNQEPAWPQAKFVTSGNLKVTATGEPVWRETSADVTTSPRVVDPDEFLIRAGDSVAVDFPFETELAGKNMQAQLSVDWAAETRVPDSVFGRYTILNEHGEELGSTAAGLGEQTLIELTPPEDGSATTSYTVQVQLDFAGLDDRFGADSVDQLEDLGDLTIELHQARPGDEIS